MFSFRAEFLSHSKISIDLKKKKHFCFLKCIHELRWRYDWKYSCRKKSWSANYFFLLLDQTESLGSAGINTKKNNFPSFGEIQVVFLTFHFLSVCWSLCSSHACYLFCTCVFYEFAKLIQTQYQLHKQETPTNQPSNCQSPAMWMSAICVMVYVRYFQLSVYVRIWQRRVCVYIFERMSEWVSKRVFLLCSKAIKVKILYFHCFVHIYTHTHKYYVTLYVYVCVQCTCVYIYVCFFLFCFQFLLLLSVGIENVKVNVLNK